MSTYYAYRISLIHVKGQHGKSKQWLLSKKNNSEHVNMSSSRFCAVTIICCDGCFPSQNNSAKWSFIFSSLLKPKDHSEALEHLVKDGNFSGCTWYRRHLSTLYNNNVCVSTICQQRPNKRWNSNNLNPMNPFLCVLFTRS